MIRKLTTLTSFLILLASTSKAGELQELDLRYEDALGTNRSWEYKDKKVGELDMHFNYKFFSRLDLDTNVTSKIDDHQFRYVELQPYLNFHITKDLIIYAHHRSGHCLDCTYDNISKFPNENGVGVKWILFQK